MSKEFLGMFDTPPNRRQVRFSILLLGILFVALGILLIQPDLRLVQIDAFIPVVDSIIMMGDLITATLLFVQAAIFRSRAVTVLASGYVFAAALLIAHLLSFPDAFAPNGVLGGGINTTSWIAYFWRAAIPVSIILYAFLRTADANAMPRAGRSGAMITWGVVGALGAAGAVVLLTTAGHELLPSIFLTPARINFSNTLRINWALLGLLSVTSVILYRRRRSVLDMWLLVALATWIAHALLNLETWGRYTVGFYSQFLMLLFSHFLLMLALIAETSRLYTRLALSTAARRRERDARMMSMDAVTAAIAHEVGQPLAAAGLNAAAALNWLTSKRPNVKKAIASVRAVSEQADRTFDIIRSIRATFAKEPGRATEFSLNDLVLETAAHFELEFAASKVSLRLELDADLPPIVADRVQMQRVLVNLFTNAVESLRLIGDRARTLTIRSCLKEGRDVLLTVSDNGTGIAVDKMEHVFDPFFTTKPTGTGLGLPLCRTIIEEHRGRLWAENGEAHGATFHLQLPRSGMAELSVETPDVVLDNLEDSLRWLRQTKGFTGAVTELEHIVGEVRLSRKRPK